MIFSDPEVREAQTGSHFSACSRSQSFGSQSRLATASPYDEKTPATSTPEDRIGPHHAKSGAPPAKAPGFDGRPAGRPPYSSVGRIYAVAEKFYQFGNLQTKLLDGASG
jgi:hypothetical protein